MKNREEFMNFFRDDNRLNLLTTDDRIEIFSTILQGATDIKMDLLNSLLIDYCVDNIEIIERK